MTDIIQTKWLHAVRNPDFVTILNCMPALDLRGVLRHPGVRVCLRTFLVHVEYSTGLRFVFRESSSDGVSNNYTKEAVWIMGNKKSIANNITDAARNNSLVHNINNVVNQLVQQPAQFAGGLASMEKLIADTIQQLNSEFASAGQPLRGSFGENIRALGLFLLVFVSDKVQGYCEFEYFWDYEQKYVNNYLMLGARGEEEFDRDITSLSRAAQMAQEQASIAQAQAQVINVPPKPMLQRRTQIARKRRFKATPIDPAGAYPQGVEAKCSAVELLSSNLRPIITAQVQAFISQKVPRVYKSQTTQCNARKAARLALRAYWLAEAWAYVSSLEAGAFEKDLDQLMDGKLICEVLREDEVKKGRLIKDVRPNALITAVINAGAPTRSPDPHQHADRDAPFFSQVHPQESAEIREKVNVVLARILKQLEREVRIVKMNMR